MQMIDLPEGARVLRVTPHGHDTTPAPVDYALEEMDVWWERLSRLGYIEEQLDAVRALISRDTLAGMDIANALDLERL